MSQGQSKNTSDKESAFAVCLSYHMASEARFLTGQRQPVPYFHVDLNAGAGYNRSAGIVGSPRIFLNVARKHRQLPIRAWFVERNRDRMEALRAEVCESGSLFNCDRVFEPLKEDNRETLRRLVADVSRHDRPAYARGSIVSDPNGWSPKQGALDLALAADVLRQLPHFMLLVSFFWGRAKAMQSLVNKGTHNPIAKNGLATRRVADYLTLRPHWLISEPSGQWCYLCGTVRPIREWVRPDGWRLVDISSARGQELIRHYDDLPQTTGEAA